MRIPLLLSALLLLGACAGSPSAAQPPSGPLIWGCDAPVGRTCYFSIQFAAGGVRNFSLPSGRKMTVTGVIAGRDHYQVSIEAPNLGDPNRCRQLVTMGRSCIRKPVDSSYND
jgi:hypothetical protein